MKDTPFNKASEHIEKKIYQNQSVKECLDLLDRIWLDLCQSRDGKITMETQIIMDRMFGCDDSE